jgi:alpha-glucosidase (family GH31 glycosyl hydrolase)
MQTDILGLCHDPYGMEHPYEQEPIERIPRDPEAGQSVTLGVATFPVGVAESVWATWSVEGDNKDWKAQGQWIKDEGEHTYWKVELPAFEENQRVSYCLHAHQGGRQISSDVFLFSVSKWRNAGLVDAFHFSTQGLEVECGTVDTALQPIIAFDFRQPNIVHVTHSALALAGEKKESRRASPQKVPEGAVYKLLEQTPEQLTVVTGTIMLTIHCGSCRMEVRRHDGSLLLQEVEPPSWLVCNDGRPLEVRQVFTSPLDEAFYGFGERFNALDQRGNELDVWVFDQYKKQGKRTYIPVPFFQSSKDYGMYLNTSRCVIYDLAFSQPDRWSYRAEVGLEGTLEYDLMVADTPKEILITYTDITGKPDLPPIWVFGPWMSGNEWNSQRTVMEQVKKTLEYEIPVTVLVIEAWGDETTSYIWNDAQYSPKPPGEPFRYGDFSFPSDGKWPNPKGMIGELHRLGVRVLLWQIPVMKKQDTPHAQHDADEAYMIDKGYCVREANGQPYRVRPFWFNGGLVLDFTHQEAVEWWLSKRAYLLGELGVDGFKTDGGEHLWGGGLRFADGRQGDEVWNLYPNLYVGAYHRFTVEKRNGDAITFSRAGFTSCQAYPCHWAGDEDSTWEAFRASVLAGMNAGLSGISFWGWDLAGFSGEIPTAELYLRAAAMAAFCPIMQYHSEFNQHHLPCRDRTPWNIQERTGDGDVIPIFRHYANLRMNLLPYLYSEARKSSRSGIPLMRAMHLEFPDDPAVHEFPYQYFLGNELLVAPVVQEGALSWSVYLPVGRWYDLWTGETFQGPSVIDYPTPKEIIPVFARADTILPLNLGEDYSLGDPVGNAVDRFRNLCFMVYPSSGTHHMFFDMVLSKTTYIQHRVTPDRDSVVIEIEKMDHIYSLIIVGGPPKGVIINGQSLQEARDPTVWRNINRSSWVFDQAKGVVLIRIDPHQSPRVIEVVGMLSDADSG